MSKKLTYLVSFVLTLSFGVSVTNADLLARYTFEDGSAKDLIGGFDGTFNGDATVIADPEAGPRGMVLSLDGDGDSVLIPKIAETIEFTYAMWIYQEEVKSGLISTVTHTAWSTGSVHWGVNSGQPKIGINGSIDPGGDLLGPDPLPAGEWIHLTLVKSETLLLHYVNGEEVARRDLTRSDSVIIGEANLSEWSGGRYFHGMFDDFQVYDHALSEVEILGAMQGEIWPYAWGPTPEDGSMHFDTWANLSWSPGGFAVSHDVYMGENFDEVEAGAESTFQGNQTDTFLVAGFPGFAYPEGLVPGTTYYWRIDEVNDTEPNSPWKGDVWSFSVPPKTAYNPDPPDGAGFVDLDAVFTWTPGFGGKLHTVYMGTNFDEVDNAEGGTPLGTASYSPPAALELEKVYYWRVDEFDPPFTHKGDIWNFTTPGAVGNPQPANGEVDVQMTATLSWTAADNAASHELYFGTDKDAVNNATTASPEYIGPRALGSESYDPGKLAWDATSYWRVDEVYSTETVKGIVWSFATADFILVDDFESYNDIDPPDPNSNRIFDKWIDGFGTTDNGALVGNDLPPYAEQSIVHGGAQSMPYFYDNNLKTSEATLTLVYPRDWTEEGIAKLSLWFRGASANAADRMFVALGDAVVYHDDAAATQMTGWNEWVIDLAAFGVDLTNVGSITIGVGTKNAPAAGGGTGTMYFDDIRLIR